MSTTLCNGFTDLRSSRITMPVERLDAENERDSTVQQIPRKSPAASDQKTVVDFAGGVLFVGGIVFLNVGFPLMGCTIKGNISRNTGEHIFHVPGQRFYSATRINWVTGERWFCSEDAARAAGWRKSKL